LEREKEAEELGIEDYFQGEGITAIEWADKIPALLPKEMLLIRIAYTGKNIRSIEIIAKGKRYLNLIDQIRSSKLGIRKQKK
jgi:tRNA threonylcarbamoyladenosine biosynthesis protein TsaE